MKKFIKKYWLLILAVVIGFTLRFYKVGDLPSILNRDEAALAYNAYLLAETGRDEWGRAWPLTLESFGDYKLPGYTWALVPWFKVFGLSDTIVRMPSVLAGCLLIVVFYLWLKTLGVKEKFSLLGAWLIALLPVSIFYSRMAYEANIGLTLMVIDLWLITLLSKKWSSKAFIPLIASLLLGVFTYNTPWILLPFFIVYVLLIFSKKDRKKSILLSGVIAGIFLLGAKLLLPLASQKSGITIFSDETTWDSWIKYRENLNPKWLWLLGSQYVYWVGLMWTKFWQSFTPSFLVTSGGNHSWHRLPTWGHLNFLIYGMGWLGLAITLKELWSVGIKKLLSLKNLGKETRINLATLFLFFTSLAPSVITIDAPHATRSLLFFIFWVYWAVKGLSWLYESKFWPTKNMFWMIICLVIWVESLWHAQQLYVAYPKTQGMFEPGYDGMITYLEDNYPRAPIAIVDPSGYKYILTAWYLRIPPDQYFGTNVRQLPDKIGFRYGEQVTHYHFIADPNDRSEEEKILLQWISKTEQWRIWGISL